jgi:hypothetical protein
MWDFTKPLIAFTLVLGMQANEECSWQLHPSRRAMLYVSSAIADKEDAATGKADAGVTPGEVNWRGQWKEMFR